MIYARNTTRKHRLNLRAIERTAGKLLGALGDAKMGVSILFVGDRAMRRLNREYRARDRTTDVLAFPLGDGGLLGDIAINLDAAQRQARDYDAPLGTEVARLLIHGIVHLAGHDHKAAAERKRMLRVERRLARAIGLEWPYPRGARSRREAS